MKKQFVIFTLADIGGKIAIKPWDIRHVDECSFDTTLVTYTTWDEQEDAGTTTIRVVGSFEDIMEKVEATA